MAFTSQSFISAKSQAEAFLLTSDEQAFKIMQARTIAGHFLLKELMKDESLSIQLAAYLGYDLKYTKNQAIPSPIEMTASQKLKKKGKQLPRENKESKENPQNLSKDRKLDYH